MCKSPARPWFIGRDYSCYGLAGPESAAATDLIKQMLYVRGFAHVQIKHHPTSNYWGYNLQHIQYELSKICKKGHSLTPVCCPVTKISLGGFVRVVPLDSALRMQPIKIVTPKCSPKNGKPTSSSLSAKSDWTSLKDERHLVVNWSVPPFRFLPHHLLTSPPFYKLVVSRLWVGQL